MKAEIVEKIVSTAEKNNLNLEIMFDNMEVLNTKMEGTVVNFDHSNEIVVFTRITDNPTQMFIGPLEFGVRPYEDIQRLSIQATAKDMIHVVESVQTYCGDKVDKMKKFITTTPAANTYHATPSTVDVTKREGTKPQMYSTNQYGSAGENRSKRASNYGKPVTVKLNKDGSVPDGVKIPHPIRDTTDV